MNTLLRRVPVRTPSIVSRASRASPCFRPMKSSLFRGASATTKTASDTVRPLRQVFISSDGSAAKFAASLVPSMEQAGVPTFGHCKVRVGDPLKETLLQAAARSAVVVVCLSRRYTQSVWCMWELDAAINGLGQPRAFEPTIIPVLLDPIDLKFEPSQVQLYWAEQRQRQSTGAAAGAVPWEHRDVVDPERWASNVAQLLQRQCIRLAASEQGEARFLEASRLLVDLAKQALPRAPRARLPTFGFDEQASTLLAQLDRDGVTGLWLNGPGGSGLSTMVSLLVDRLAGRFEICFYIQLQNENKQQVIQLALDDLADAINADRGVIGHSGHTELEGLSQCMETKPVLYVLDNVRESAELDALLPCQPWPVGRSVIIITSSKASMPQSAKYIKVHGQLCYWKIQPLAFKDGIHLLCHAAGVANVPEGLEDIVYRIVDECEGLPGRLSLVGKTLLGQFDKFTAENILADLTQAGNKGELFEVADDQLPSKTALGWFTEALEGQSQGLIPWALFWYELKRALKDAPLDGARWKYIGHHLDQQEQRLHFQTVVSRATDVSEGLAPDDFRSFVRLTECGTLAEVIDLAMTSSWSLWQGSTHGHPGHPCSSVQQAAAGRVIVQWSVGVDSSGRILALQGRTSIAQGCGVKLQRQSMLQPGISNDTWLRMAAALHNVKHWEDWDTPAAPCSSGFAELHGAREQTGLTSFLDVPAASANASRWHIEGARLRLLDPRAVGYQVRLSEENSVDAARFLFRSFAPDTNDTLLDAVFISHTNADEDAGTFAGFLHSQLNKADIACFLDAKALGGGMEWRKLVTLYARRCSVFVAVVSPNYPKRPWPMAELHLALHERREGTGGLKPIIIPVLYDVRRADIDSSQKEDKTELAQEWVAAWQTFQPVQLGAGEQLHLCNHGKLLCSALDTYQAEDRWEKDGHKTKISDADLANQVEKRVRQYIRTYMPI